jgi:hypothetical protein
MVEKGIAPPVSTSYEVMDGQVVVAAEATDRRGLQPVVSLTVNGDAMCRHRDGRRSDLPRAIAQVPDGAGEIVSIEWDFDGAGDFPVRESVNTGDRAVVEQRHSLAVPGTYFSAVRVAAHRDGDTRTPYARIQNLARVRIVVS